MTKDICVNPTQTVTSLENKRHFSASWDVEKSWVPTPPLQDSVILWSNTSLAPYVTKRGVKKGKKKGSFRINVGFFSIFWAKLWLSIALRPVKNCKFRAFRLWSGLQNSVWSLELNVRMPQKLGKCPRESSCPAILEAMQEQGIKSTAEPQLQHCTVRCESPAIFLPNTSGNPEVWNEQEREKEGNALGEGGNIGFDFSKLSTLLF